MKKIKNIKLNPDKNDKKVMKYPNGAVAKALEDGDEYWSIRYYEDTLITSHYWNFEGDQYDRAMLKNQNVFKTRKDAEKWLDVLNTHNKLLKKIVEINYENGWVADLENDEQKKYCLYWYTGGNKEYSVITNERYGDVIMSKQAKDYMMSDKVSDEDFKKFLFIID